MRTFTIRTLAVGALAMLTFLGIADAQTASPAVLNTLEVQMLVASQEPDDQARLSAHFEALAERYAAEAARHEAMAHALVGNPTRTSVVNNTPDHCKRLAELNTRSAATLRELAAHHERLATGTPSNAPRGGARFQAGAGASEPTDAELAALAPTASTPAEHRALEEYFLTAAKRYKGEVGEHAAMAQTYRATRMSQAASHCDRLVKLARDEAKEATVLAEKHKQMAGITFR